MQKVSGLVSELKSVTLKKSTLTDDIARELYEARKELDSRGFNKGKENVPNGTFSQYLNDCGLARTTVYNWLEHYEPEEQRLLTDEEYQAKLVTNVTRLTWEGYLKDCGQFNFSCTVGSFFGCTVSLILYCTISSTHRRKTILKRLIKKPLLT